MTTQLLDCVIRAARDDDDLDAYAAHDVSYKGASFIRAACGSVAPDRPRAVLLADVDGRPAAFGYLFGHAALPGGFGVMRVSVKPEFRGRGLGRRLLDRLLATEYLDALPGYGNWAVEDETASMQVLEHWGCQRAGRHYESELDLVAADGVLDGLAARATSAGISLVSLPADATDDDWSSAMAFLADRWQEGPDFTEDAEVPPVAFFRGQFHEPWQVLLAMHDGEPVGITTVLATSPTVANTFFTGVRPDFRNRGLATALKAGHARELLRQGVTTLQTQNMDVNAHILAANDRLGFRRLRTYVEMLRPLPA